MVCSNSIEKVIDTKRRQTHRSNSQIVKKPDKISIKTSDEFTNFAQFQVINLKLNVVTPEVTEDALAMKKGMQKLVRWLNYET